jgi:hypothetical protein
MIYPIGGEVADWAGADSMLRYWPGRNLIGPGAWNEFAEMAAWRSPPRASDGERAIGRGVEGAGLGEPAASQSDHRRRRPLPAATPC